MTPFRAAALAVLALAAPAPAADQWAVLIGVQTHDVRELDLGCPAKDVAAVERVLLDRAGLDPRNVLKLTDAADPARRPTRDNLTAQVPAFLKRAKPGDRVLVFFSGHGLRVGNQTYLIPRDFHPDRATDTGVPVSELRKWLGPGGCAAAMKFLVLDCCHAGSADGAKSVEGDKVAEAAELDGVPGAVVLASCRAKEKSYEWPERGQGVFTYWLCRALEGAATEGDGKVTFDRVNKYVHDRVRSTARVRFGKPQTPVRYGEAEGDPPVLVLHPEPEDTFCRRLAADLDLDARRAKVKSVGVLEFFLPYGQKEEDLGRAPLPRFLAEQVAARLKELAGSDYAVVGPEAMAASAKDIGVAEVRKSEQLKELGRKGKAEAVVFGVVRPLAGRYSVRCELVRAAGGDDLGKAGGVLALKAERVGDLGESADLRPAPPGGPYDPKVTAFAQEQAGLGHPLQVADFAFPLEVWAGGKKKDYAVQTGKPGPDGRARAELLVTARKGEEFELRVGNRSKNRVAVRLLVDGFNTLDQVRGLTDRGRAWVLEPRAEAYRIDGWYLRKGAAGGGKADYDVRRFKFVDVGNSVAGRKGFTDGIGLITMAVYEEGDRSVAVGEGVAFEKVVREVPFRFGRCLAVVQVRYVDEADTKR